jgi:hypothetical protein
VAVFEKYQELVAPLVEIEQITKTKKSKVKKMSYAIEQQEWQNLPEHAQREIYDFFLFIKQRYATPTQPENELSELTAFSNHSANLVEEWASEKEDEIWT